VQSKHECMRSRLKKKKHHTPLVQKEPKAKAWRYTNLQLVVGKFLLEDAPVSLFLHYIFAHLHGFGQIVVLAKLDKLCVVDGARAVRVEHLGHVFRLLEVEVEPGRTGAKKKNKLKKESVLERSEN